MFAFVVGGSFLSLAVNDLTWLIFGLVAALDRVSRQPAAAPAPVRREEEAPLPVHPMWAKARTVSEGR